MMTAGELAALIDGADYGLCDCQDEIKLAKENGLVIVYGASDDLMEFAGAIDDEAGVYEGGTVYLNADGLMRSPCCDDEFRDCPYYKREMEHAKFIKAVWCPEGTDFAWVYETEIPHETFRVLEDGEHYCLGIVFGVEDLKQGAT